MSFLRYRVPQRYAFFRHILCFTPNFIGSPYLLCVVKNYETEVPMSVKSSGVSFNHEISNDLDLVSRHVVQERNIHGWRRISTKAAPFIVKLR
jgi:hypothetical protein